jgi:hypothetical protein
MLPFAVTRGQSRRTGKPFDSRPLAFERGCSLTGGPESSSRKCTRESNAVGLLEFPPIPSSIGLRLAVAVGTQHSKIFESMIVIYTIAVIDLDCQRASSPISETALFTDILQEAGHEQTTLDGVAAPRVSQDAL